MDPEIRNFAEIEKFIRENPREADLRASEWREFLKRAGKENPDLFLVESANDWYEWLSHHKELTADPDLFVGKEIQDSYFYLRGREEDRQMQQQGFIDSLNFPSELLALPLVAGAFLDRPKTLEEDPEYQKIVKNKKQEWLAKNNRQDFQSLEGLDYIYGSLVDESLPSLAKDAQSEFRQNPRYKKRLERYDKEKKKVYKNLSDDPSFLRLERLVQEEFNARFELAKREGTQDVKIDGKIWEKRLDEFAKEHPEKARTYGASHEGIKKAYQKQQMLKALSEYETRTGRQVKVPEKIHRAPGVKTVEQAAEQLARITPQSRVAPIDLEIPPARTGIRPPSLTGGLEDKTSDIDEKSLKTKQEEVGEPDSAKAEDEGVIRKEAEEEEEEKEEEHRPHADESQPKEKKSKRTTRQEAEKKPRSKLRRTTDNLKEKLRAKLSQFRKNLPERRTVVSTAGKLSRIGARAMVQGGRTIASFFRLPSGGVGGIFQTAINGVVSIARGFLAGLFGVGPAAGGLVANPATGLIVVVVIVFILILAFFIILVSLLQTNLITLPPTELALCKFTRSDQNPAADNYKSEVLLNYFREAEGLSSVPAMVLAGIARIESPSITGYTDQGLASYGCPKSPTGALGLMQIQPPGTTGYFAPGIELGATYLGATPNQLTDADFCDMRKSVIIAAGFILKKLELGYGIGDGVRWDSQWTNDKSVINKVAEGYYGCLGYPSCSSGPYNYGDDLWTSIQNCKQSLTPLPTPGGPRPSPPPPPSDLVLAIEQQFGITMTGFPRQNMEWAWQKLWDVSNTNFINLVRGTRIRVVLPRYTQQTGCRSVDLGAFSSEELFKVVLVHELGHVIRNCNLDSVNKKDEHFSVWQQEGGVTGYARTACTYGSPGTFQYISEDYAEMITYYLNPSANEQTASCAGTAPNPYSGGRYRLHFTVARDILGTY